MYHPNSIAMFMYADDTSLTVSAPTLNETSEITQTLLTSLKCIFAHHYLQLNESKTGLVKYLRGSADQTPITVGTSVVTPSKNTMFLGVQMDSAMRWNAHIDHLCPKLLSCCYVLRKFMNTQNYELGLTIYHALFASKMTYAIEVWGSCSTASLQRVLIIQKRAIRALAKLPPRHTCKHAFKALQILTVPSVYILKILMYAKTKIEDGTFQLQTTTHNHNTRNGHNILVAPARSQRLHSSAHIKARSLFNRLPRTFKMLPLKVFKSKLKSLLRDNVFYSIEELECNLPRLCET